MNATAKGTALITGASSGIGEIYAGRFAHRGYDLILVARNQKRLSELAARLTHVTGRHVQIIVADLTRKTDLAQVESVLRSDPSITVLVNNAGISMKEDLSVSDSQQLESMIHLNVLAPTMLV